MKRARGVDEISPSASSAAPAAAGASTLKQHSVGGGGGPAGGGTEGGGGVPGRSGGGSGHDYHPGDGSIGLLSGQAVRAVQPKDMPGTSIQFSQTQQQYPGAIVVPTAAASSVKVSHAVAFFPLVQYTQASLLTGNLESQAFWGMLQKESIKNVAPIKFI